MAAVGWKRGRGKGASSCRNCKGVSAKQKYPEILKTVIRIIAAIYIALMQLITPKHLFLNLLMESNTSKVNFIGP